MQAQSVRERPFAVLLAALAVNTAALVGLFTAAPTYQATTSVTISASADAAPAPDLTQVAAATVAALRSSDTFATADGSEVTLADRSVDGSFLLVATATAATRASAESAASAVGEQASAQIRADAPGVSATTVDTPAVVAAHSVSVGRVLGFGAAAALVALALIALTAPAGRRPAEAVAVTHRPPAASPPTGGVLRLAPDADDRDDDLVEPLAPPARQPSPAPSRLTGRERTATIKRMVQEDWVRSGSNVPWTKQQTRAAFARAEERLAAQERTPGGPGRFQPPGGPTRADDWPSWGTGG